MKQIATIFFSFLFLFTFFGTVEGQVRINEVRANASGNSGSEAEFIELIGLDGTDITGYQIVHYNGASTVDGSVWTHTIGSFIISDDGINDINSNNLGIYVLGVNGFSTAIGIDETTSDNFQNGPDGIVLYDNLGNIVDAIAWEGAGDLADDDPGTVTTTGSPKADNYLHITADDDNTDNSLEAPDDVIGDNGSGWTNTSVSIGNINSGQNSGSIILETSIKAEPTNHVTSFSATGLVNSVDLSWTDAIGSPLPDAYLIKVSDAGFGSISAPTDNNPESNDTDLSDGTGALNINEGVQSASFSGLNETKIYYFKIYAYTNTGTDINYKTVGSVPQDDATTLVTPDIVVNEILSDPNGDANGDGAIDTDDDEFLEFVNIGTTNLDISNWTIEDSNGTTHTFDNPTILKPLQATLVFGGGTPAGDFGGALIQTTGSLSLNNGGDDVILKNSSGVEIFNISYSGASDESETRNPDLTGAFEDHTTADSEDGTEFSPGTRIDGFAFQPRVEITGNEGWRMLSTPTSDNKYNDLLNNIWTQCSGGADYNGAGCNTSDEPNVQFYDISTDQFEGVSDLDGTGSTGDMTPGQGFIVYVYSDDDFNGSADGFPKTLEMFGTENSGTVDPPLNTGSEAATLVGNPFLVPIDWDDLTKTDLTGTAYVYDDSYGSIIGAPDEEASGVSGSYRAWSSSLQTGSLTDGLIAPLQAFWVINSSGTPSPDLKMIRDATIKGGSFYKRIENDIPKIQFRAENNYMFNESYLSFSVDGLVGKDYADGYELTPLDYGDYISLSTEVEGTQMDINNLPVELYNPVEIPLHIQAFEAKESGWSLMGGEVTLSWPEMNNIPSEWKITLTDKKLNRKIDLKSAKNYLFEAEGSQAKIANKKPFSPFNPKPFQKEKAVNDARFLITINPNVPDGLIDDNIPDQFTLEQNYPNPFNPTTNIKFEIAETSDVTLNVYNVMGQRVASLVNEVKAPGTYEIAWDAQEMASGIYYYRLRAGGVVFNRQMTLIK